jgi:tRNA(Ile)-lysidine synthase
MTNRRKPASSRATASSEQPRRLPFFVHRALRTVESVLRETGVTAQPVLLAVSGGGDSMALLELVSMLAPTLDLELHVASIDHGVRAEAAVEVELVREAASSRGATFHTTRICTDRTDEDALRRARHAALAEIADASGCRWILLGHTSDEQIETIVFRFLRGAGLGGLAGMRPVRGRLVRPLLGIRRDELRRILRERQVRWAEDATNVSGQHARGRLRNVVLPAIASTFGAGALEHLLDVAPRWRDDEDYLEAEAARLLALAAGPSDPGRAVPAQTLDLATLAAAHRSLRARALRQWLVASTGNVPSSRELSGVERWLERRRGASSIDIAGAKLVQSRGRLLVSASDRNAGECIASEIDRSADSTTSGGDATADGSVKRVEARVFAEDALLPPSEARVRFSRT